MARRTRLVSAWLAAAACHAAAMQPMPDAELAAVRGSDGLAFNLQNFSLAGPLTLTYTMPGPAGANLWLSNLSLSRSDDPAATFSDPYHLKVVARGNGLADVIRLSEPANANGALKWQFAADWGVNADGIAFQGGALVVQDLVTRGGSVTLTTSATPGVEGIAFGLAIRADIGNVTLRPRGRDDAGEQWQLAGVRLGAASGSGVLLGSPWAIADATNQPGIVNAVTDGQGVSTLHLGIGWPTTAAGAAIGGLAIDSIVFKSDALPGGQLDLGSSRVGTMQIQYLDVKLKAGF
jgi:hypothetical protein